MPKTMPRRRGTDNASALKQRKEAAGSELPGNHSVVNEIIDILIRDTEGNETVRDYNPRKLPSKAHYKAGRGKYDYYTDKTGRIVRGHADELKRKPKDRKRLDHDSRSHDKIKGVDNAGHIFADRFEGSPELDNILSQAESQNQAGGAWHAMEDHWDWVMDQPGGKISNVEVGILYDDDSRRPSRYLVRYDETLDGETVPVTMTPFENVKTPRRKKGH